MTAPPRSLAAKLVRYTLASLSGTIIGQGTFQLFYTVLDWAAFPSNITSVTLGTIPNYFINRYWTWQRAGRDRMGAEATVFWIMALIGLLISTGTVAYADSRWGDSDETTKAIAGGLAQASGYALLWVAKFVFLDKVLYKATHHEELEPTHGSTTP